MSITRRKRESPVNPLAKQFKALEDRHIRLSDRPLSDAVRIVTYETVTGPMPYPDVEAMAPADRDRFCDLIDDIRAGNIEPGYATDLEALRDRYPKVPKIYNFLSVAYANADSDDDYRRIVNETWARFPRYVFGMANYLRQCMTDGRMDEAERILGNRLLIKAMYPERDVFHVSEDRSFMAVVIEYLIRQRRIDDAEAHLNLLKATHPDHPVTRHVTRLFDYAVLLDAVSNLAQRRKRKRNRRR